MDDSILRTNTEPLVVDKLPKLSSLFVEPLQLLELITQLSYTTEEVVMSDREYVEDILFEGQFQSWTAEQYSSFMKELNQKVVIEWVEPDSIRRYFLNHFTTLLSLCLVESLLL